MGLNYYERFYCASLLLILVQFLQKIQKIKDIISHAKYLNSISKFIFQDIEVKQVNLSSIVALNILKHAYKDTNLSQQRGQLLGVYYKEDGTLEISQSYPVALKETDNYHLNKMKKKLEEVNLDTEQVGWYYVVGENEQMNIDALSLQKLFEDEGAYNIMLCYDKDEAVYGTETPFRAYQLSDIMKQLHLTYLKEETNTDEKDVFNEIPVVVENSPLTKLFIEKHKDTLLKKYEQPDENYNIMKYLQKTTSDMTHEIYEQSGEQVQFQLQRNLLEMEEFLKPSNRNDKKLNDRFHQTVDSFSQNFLNIHKVKNYSKKLDDTTNYLLQSGDAWQQLFQEMKQ